MFVRLSLVPQHALIGCSLLLAVACARAEPELPRSADSTSGSAAIAPKLVDLPSREEAGSARAQREGTLNALLPAKFFVHQDELAASATALAQAAAARDDRKLVEAFGAVTKSCVGCHAAYLHADLEPFEHEEPGAPLSCAYSDSCDEHNAASD